RETVPGHRGVAGGFRSTVSLALDLRRGDPGPLRGAVGPRRCGARGLRVPGDALARREGLESQVARLSARPAGFVEDPACVPAADGLKPVLHGPSYDLRIVHQGGLSMLRRLLPLALMLLAVPLLA